MNERRSIVEELRAFVDHLTKHPPHDFARAGNLGQEWEFSELVPSLEVTFDLLKHLVASDLQHVPDEQLRKVIPAVNKANTLLKHVMAFSSVTSEENPDPRQKREKLIARVKNVGDEIFDLVSPLISYLAARGDSQEIEKLRQRTAAELDSIQRIARERAEAVATEGERIIREADDIRATARATSADVGVAQHSAIFRDEAENHRKSGQVWLTRTAWFALIALVASALSVWHSLCTSVLFPDSVPGTVSKLALLAVLYYAVIWSARMYRSDQHNAVINQHRHNALRTFETFVNASGDDATKNAVLLHATDTIFSHQASGYSERVQEPNSQKVLEVLPNLSLGARD